MTPDYTEAMQREFLLSSKKTGREIINPRLYWGNSYPPPPKYGREKHHAELYRVDYMYYPTDRRDLMEVKIITPDYTEEILTLLPKGWGREIIASQYKV